MKKSIGLQVAEALEAFDPYGFRGAFDSMEEAAEAYDTADPGEIVKELREIVKSLSAYDCDQGQRLLQLAYEIEAFCI